jgi:hypothetical protein
MEARVQDRISARSQVADVGAAAEALQWAETAAERGDFDLATKWLDRAEELLGGLTPRYQRRKRTWKAAGNDKPRRSRQT